MELAQKIKQLRSQLNLQQQDVATYMGLTRQTYALVEKGTKDLTLPQLEKLAGFLHTSIAELLYGPRILDDSVINSKKLDAIIMMCLEYGGNDWHAMVKYKLCQLVALIDLEWYRKHGSSMLSRTYMRFFNGPAVDHFYWALDGLYEEGRVQIDYRAGNIIVSATESGAERDLEPAERLFVKNMAEAWAGKTAGDLGAYISRQVGWKLMHVGSYIPYDFIKAKR